MPTEISGDMSGLSLSEAYFGDIVEPLLATAFPRLAYAASLIGAGSEVLGFDDARSRDHDWGLRLQLFVEDAGQVAEIDTALATALPDSFRGLPTRFSRHGSAVRHQIEVTTADTWFSERLGFDPRGDIAPVDWLSTPSFRLAEITGGAVFADASGTLSRIRGNLAWYPDDLWLWVLASQWQKLSQEEAFAGRTAETGDDLGSRVIAARLARDLMQLWLFMHRVYPPYLKWLGQAFARLPGVEPVHAALLATMDAQDWPTRQAALVAAFEATAREHNRLSLTDPLSPEVSDYHNRPFKVLQCDRFAAALMARITDPQIASLPLVGTAGQFLDSTDASIKPDLPRAIAAAFLQTCE